MMSTDPSWRNAASLTVEPWPIERVSEYPGNPRKHSKKGIAAIAASIRTKGWRQPLVVNPRGVLIIGHGRLRAAVQLGLEEVPVHVAHGLSEDQERALRLADNRVGELSGWDDALVTAELGMLREAGYSGLEAVGFGADFLDGLGAPGLTAEASKLLPKETDLQPGDVLECGESRAVCGSSLVPEVRSLALEDADPRLCVTDPPFGVDYHPRWWLRRSKVAVEYQSAGFDDTVSMSQYCAAILEDIDVLYIWHASLWRVDLEAQLRRQGFDIRAELVWVKARQAISRGHFAWQHEPCLYAIRTGRPNHWTGAIKAKTVLKPDWEDETVIAAIETMLRSGHPTQKPLECMARPIRYSSEVGEWVWDPFLGSGSTLLAAEREGRRCAGVELSPLFCEVIRRRAKEVGLKVRRRPGAI